MTEAYGKIVSCPRSRDGINTPTIKGMHSLVGFCLLHVRRESAGFVTAWLSTDIYLFAATSVDSAACADCCFGVVCAADGSQRCATTNHGLKTPGL